MEDAVRKLATSESRSEPVLNLGRRLRSCRHKGSMGGGVRMRGEQAWLPQGCVP